MAKLFSSGVLTHFNISQTKYPIFVCLCLAHPLHHLQAHPLLQHLTISPLSHLLLNLKSSGFYLTVLTSNVILILSPLGFSRNSHLPLCLQSLTSSTLLSPLDSFTPSLKNLSFLHCLRSLP